MNAAGTQERVATLFEGFQHCSLSLRSAALTGA